MTNEPPQRQTPGPGTPHACSTTSRRRIHHPALLSIAPLAVLMLWFTLMIPQAGAATASLLGWNNLGMHCMDSDYSVFSILPPYNTIEAQLIVGGKLVKAGTGYSITYEAIPDPDGSINSTSIGKGNFYDYTGLLYGPLAPDAGLAGWGMPGASNVPQKMLFETMNQPVPGVFTPVNWFRAEGIPITPTDDAGRRNSYPLMRLVARNSTGVVIAKSDIVVPVSDEMDCTACHGTQENFRQNILAIHDTREFERNAAGYTEALGAMGYRPDGLHPTALAGQPILCAKCHASEALGTRSYGSIPPLTTAMHSRHAEVADPITHKALGSAENRSSCYRCHPGSDTRCLRGAMGSAVAADGSMAMQCQSCHGSMSRVGSPNRVGWFMEPNCQACHTGTATHNNGKIRYESVFEDNGNERVAIDQTFATNPNTPAPGISLYRFSAGHGGLQCSACHGSTHAEFPAGERNDNVRNIQLQGHAGVTAECTACHTSMPTQFSGGPHGLHPLGQEWVDRHHDAVSQQGLATCQACHGADNRGTVLSRVQGNRNFRIGDTTSVSFYRGATVGCYTCHRGPSEDALNTSAPPAIQDVAAATSDGVPVKLTLPVGDPKAVLRILTQPSHGTVGLSNNVATYFPAVGFSGIDTFTFASYDGSKNSALATGTVSILDPVVITTQPLSQTVRAGLPVSLSVVASGTAPISYQWTLNGAAITGATSASLDIAGAMPADAGSYQVIVSNPVGPVASQIASLTVLVPPTITLQPLSQTSIQGSAVVLTTAASGIPAPTYQWYKNQLAIPGATATSLAFSAITPADAGNYCVIVENEAGTAVSATATVSVVPPPPVISGFTPSSGGVGTAVTISGSNLKGATLVKFNGIAAPFTLLASGQIVAGVPKGATTGRISVTTPGGTALSASSYYVGSRSATPSVSSMSPTSGPVGTRVVLTGSQLGAATSARIGTVNASFSVVSANQILVTIPTGAVSSRITVTTAGGTVSSGMFSVTR